MTTPFYVSPEQLMKDRADYARKGIARGRSVVVISCQQGIVFVAENPSRALHKISEIYDRIAFAAVGKYNEFENLRIAGVRLADLRGYSFDRRDVTGRWLANAYAQTLGAIFSGPGEKPYEVEIVVAEVGPTPEDDQLYRLTYDGSVADERHYVCMGGQAEALTGVISAGYQQEGMDIGAALRLAVDGLAQQNTGEPGAAGDGRRQINADQLEVAVLDRARPRRKFRRVSGAALSALLDPDAPSAPETDDAPTPQLAGDLEPSPQTSLAGGEHEPAGPDGEDGHGDTTTSS